ncbi:cytochrome P450 4X1 [Pipistrellus kuhlii]|uniref:Cytochrome P450 family 4 subfamily X member 1 n=3 Tax=Pipistrellus kuhlii TaxID=59472 RepID=A0A7J8A4Z7_PIPKU|nr:cytochrome P450 4X1 [Pipistrellus kuhlii]KAF6381637.1 cytochrome P450 family 4 subfamily X member 1 [Pipistrellus kuhlii]
METSWLEMRWTRSFYLVFVLFLTLVLLQAIKLFLRRQQLQRVLRAFPGPSPHWLTGNQKLFQDGDFELFEEFVKKYPCAFPAWIGPFEAFFQIYDPDYAKTFMNRSDPKTQYFYKYLTLITGEGLVSLNGNRWYQHRRLITPVFHFNTLKSHSRIMAQSINTLLDKWEKICGTQEAVLEVFNDISLMSLDILMKCTFSQDTNCQINSAFDDYTKGICEGSEIIHKRSFSFLYHHDIIFKFSSEKHRLQKIANNLYQYTDKIIQERRKALKEEKKHGKTNNRNYQDFLDILLSAQAEHDNSFSDTDLHAEVNTFMVAGQDTVAGTLSWLLYNLAQNPEHQERCREEIRGILGDESSITWDHLSKMTYTTMCIKETLRLYPTIVSISRQLSKPITFPDGRSLPAGMTVVLSIWGLHHNPAIWENPKVFDPLRFSPENLEKRHNYSFLPFSAGPRNCIGQNFAMTELKMAIAMILLRFKMMLDPTRPLILVPRIILKPKNGFYLSLKKIS